mgnify:CR=1 FL=1|jgi:hypothetical protein
MANAELPAACSGEDQGDVTRVRGTLSVGIER